MLYQAELHPDVLRTAANGEIGQAVPGVFVESYGNYLNQLIDEIPVDDGPEQQEPE